ncbi:hypothetical protein SS50377_27075 [Spironucleus salmonicida]|uniref:Uncharacterized protein n=1 Tax=Spironucleus salmonicida TaxID=348837 RepID=A0A9P8RVQ7_9EUKA|nr:hypothetical protein SS50377_27075 [Spironucleus salmonicida]
MLIGNHYKELILLAPQMSSISLSDIILFADIYGRLIHPNDLKILYTLCCSIQWSFCGMPWYQGASKWYKTLK